MKSDGWRRCERGHDWRGRPAEGMSALKGSSSMFRCAGYEGISVMACLATVAPSLDVWLAAHPYCRVS